MLHNIMMLPGDYFMPQEEMLPISLAEARHRNVENQLVSALVTLAMLKALVEDADDEATTELVGKDYHAGNTALDEAYAESYDATQDPQHECYEEPVVEEMGGVQEAEDVKWLQACCSLATAYSDDPRTKLACVVVKDGKVIGAGANSIPFRLKKESERLEGDNKYKFIEHAERNAIYNCAFKGNSTHGATLYGPWVACVECTRAIIQAGITRVVYDGQAYATMVGNPKWHEQVELGLSLMREAGIEVICNWGFCDRAMLLAGEHVII